MTIKESQEYIKKICEERGWDKHDNVHTFMLLTEEVGELAKAIRKEEKFYIEAGKEHGGVADELADVFSYILDIANRYNVDLEKALVDKQDCNKERVWTN